MSKIGIIANPNAGKDIRRFVGQALVVGNQEKVNIVKRVLIGAQAAGVEQIMIMPDYHQIGSRCIHDLRNQFPHIEESVVLPEMLLNDAPSDSIQVVNIMQEWGAQCIVVLGGDGTVRVVAKAAGSLPLLPISTGTNNVIPIFLEGTIAGLAAGYFSLLSENKKLMMVDQQKKLDILVNSKQTDTALVDVAVINDDHIGSRAVWDVTHLLQVIVTQASPVNIGFSSIIGKLQTITREEPVGCSAIIAKDESGVCVKAPIGPGMIKEIRIESVEKCYPGKPVVLIDKRPFILALDGEREVLVTKDDKVDIVLRSDGPNFINPDRVLAHEQIYNKKERLMIHGH